MASALGSSPSPPSFFSSLSSVFSSFLSSDLLSLSLLASADFFSAVSSWPVALAAALAVTSSPCCATALASFGVSMYYCQPCANLPSLRALGRRRTLACSAACFSWFTPGASSALGAPPVLPSGFSAFFSESGSSNVVARPVRPCWSFWLSVCCGSSFGWAWP